MNPVEPLFIASELECRRGRRRLFRDVSVRLAAGEMLHVTGRNGSGKSTLLRTLCGLTRPERGSVAWRGKPVLSSRDAFNAELVYVGHAAALKDDLTARENLAVAMDVAGLPADTAGPGEILAELGLSACADLPARNLSQGQRRRVALARLWLSGAAPLWVLDEPFVALDAQATGTLRALLERHLDGGGVLVLTTHQEIAIAPQRTQRLELDS